ncbi:MAG TPA: hypothetical protein VHY08_09620 [Bacillota bacterium]|nr:hypothetical protein [Bacillota bacterium]
MPIFNKRDFNIQTAQQKQDLRDKLELLGEELVEFAKIACPNRIWGAYVTGKTYYSEEWGALYPFNVKGNKDFIINFPYIYYHIPQNGDKVGLAVNCEFKNTRDMLFRHFNTYTIQRFLLEIQRAKGAKVVILKKEVLYSDRRVYNWRDLWDKRNLPEIDVSVCTVDYLNKFFLSINDPPDHKNPDWIWEPVFLVRYEFEHSKVINNKDVGRLFGEKVLLLAPIIEHIVWGLE